MISAVSAPFRPARNVALSYLFLLVIGIQGFHVVEHIVLVIQVEALGIGLAHAHGLLGARVDFEWLHFSYNSAFLGALIVMLVYGLRHRDTLPAATGLPGMALAAAVGLQTYHVAEHVMRIVQYYQTGCTPCLGLIGRVVPFIWPHLFFGLIAYIPMVVCYFAYGLHRRLVEFVASQVDTWGLGAAQAAADDDRDATARRARVVEPSPRAVEPRERAIETPMRAGATVRARASCFHAPALEPPALPEFVITRRSDQIAVAEAFQPRPPQEVHHG